MDVRARIVGAIAAVVGLMSVLVVSPPALAAAGDPFDPAVPRVFVAQDLPTRLYSAVQGNGTVTLTPEGPTSAVSYNAMGFDTANNYLYAIRRDTGVTNALQRIGQGGVVVGLGVVAGLPASTATYNQGTFGAGATANILYVRETGTTNRMYAVNVNTLTATTITLSATPQLISDILYKDGYIWGFSDTDRVYRIDPATGQVVSWATGFGLNLAFGAQWVYGNGNIGLSSNDTGRVYQVRIDGSTTANPTFTIVASSAGPASANNDGAAIPGPDVDLGIVKTGPATYSGGGALSYTLTVTDNSAVGSSGYVVTDPLPAALTGATTATAGCAISAGKLTCVRGPLAAGASTTITVSGTVAAGTTGILSNTATVLGNERDPNPANDQSTATSAFSAGFSCTSGTVYGLNNTGGGAILAIDRATGASTQQGTFGLPAANLINSLAITADGKFAYAVTQSGVKTVYRYNTATGTASAIGTIPQASTYNLFMGALNPVNGYFYVGGVSGNDYVISAFDPATNSSLGEQFRVPKPPTAGGSDGDLVFDSMGRAFIVMSNPTANQLIVVANPPSDGSTAIYRLLANLQPSSAQFQGVTFGSDGYLYAQYTSGTVTLVRIDPNSGAAGSSVSIRNPDGTANTSVSDLASCSLNSTLTLRKDIAGRYAAGDQFTVTITGNGVAQGNVGTTSGTTTGVQADAAASAGPVVGVPGRTYSISEAAASGTDLTRYTTTWQCVNAASGTTVASGTGTSGSVTIPATAASGVHVVCTIRNTPIPAVPVQIQKVGEDSAGTVVAMNGSQWAVYDSATGGTAVVAGAPPALDGGGAAITGLFRVTTLTPGTYWLQETTALPGFALLAQRVGFTLTAAGAVQLSAGTASNVSVVTVGGTPTIRVQDVPAFVLPKAGGGGTGWIYLTGAILVLGAISVGAARAFLRRNRRPRGRGEQN